VLDGRFPVGAKLEIVPNHSCLTVANFDAYHVIRGSGSPGPSGDAGRVVDRWRVERGR
jgi:D-serine deaminase-like pyridoxal phosphate-dependent protein